MIEKPPPKRPYDTFGFAIWGGFCGSALVAVHLALDVFELIPGYHISLHSRGFFSKTPFLHILIEFAVFGFGGAILFGLAAWICNRLKS